MKRLILILISICLLVIDNTILPYYSINGVFPSLLFVFAIAYSIICGSAFTVSSFPYVSCIKRTTLSALGPNTSIVSLVLCNNSNSNCFGDINIKSIRGSDNI